MLAQCELLTIKLYRMSKSGLQYREETGYDVGVYCENADNEQSIWYFHEHYVHWLEQKIEALSQHDVIKKRSGGLL